MTPLHCPELQITSVLAPVMVLARVHGGGPAAVTQRVGSSVSRSLEWRHTPGFERRFSVVYISAIVKDGPDCLLFISRASFAELRIAITCNR